MDVLFKVYCKTSSHTLRALARTLTIIVPPDSERGFLQNSLRRHWHPAMVVNYRSATLVLALLSQRGRASVSRQNAVELVVATRGMSADVPSLEGRRRLVVEDDAGKLTDVTLLRLTFRAISLSLIFLPVASR